MEDWSREADGLDRPQPLDQTEQARLIRESFQVIAQHGDRVALHFFAELFLRHPELRDLFPVAMSELRGGLFDAITTIVQRIVSTGTLVPFLQQLGRDHRKYDIRTEHFAYVGEALMITLEKYAGEAWTPQVAEAWRSTYDLAAKVMLQAMQSVPPGTPRWWDAEVLHHQRYPGRIAVIVVRPHQPLPYVAGQYVTIETPYWPRVWRPFSIANAPREDHLLEFHVRAVGAGWVSNALVGKVQVGDRLKLGSAMGSMVLDETSDRPVLCVAGGTGLAPLKAIAQAFARDPRGRTLHLFFGARDDDELYDLENLLHLAEACPAITVVPVVSQYPSQRWRFGSLPDVVAESGNWAGHDVYVCGPPQMVTATVRRLADQGCPTSRIFYDPVT
ncbi:globin domain-containing protein [Carbonactinospora thermoautotrophica]|uniref:globin domain-containing protein n=1 Tax=Carbonactinospora thermoautotrophica TaxID=1469144 RepID=UPI000BB4E689|nr:globin domain-containing protein [Carbonactinospora thermoautotrophica]